MRGEEIFSRGESGTEEEEVSAIEGGEALAKESDPRKQKKGVSKEGRGKENGGGDGAQRKRGLG